MAPLEDRRPWALGRLVATVCLSLALAAPAARALRPPAERRPFVHDGRLDVQPTLDRLDAAAAGERPALRSFSIRHAGTWEVFWDRRNDRPHLIQGSGIPFVPGTGNQLARADLKLDGTGPLTLADLERLARRFVAAEPELFGVSPEDLLLAAPRSGNFGRARQLWFVELGQRFHGLEVEGANLILRVNHGNLIQIAGERLAPVELDPRPELDADRAFALALAAGSFAGPGKPEARREGEARLLVLPLALEGERPGERYTGLAGRGYRHALVWEVAFRVAGDTALYRARVDAHSGYVWELADQTRYGAVKGGVYPGTYLDTEKTYHFPYTQVTSGSSSYITGASGRFPSSKSSTVTLNGEYFAIQDQCGSLSLTSSDGDLDLGTSAAGDCVTPGTGGKGNTHAARSAFYHLTRANRLGATYFPANPWLASKVTVNTDVNDTCNATWDGQLNFYRSGGGCGNSGQIAAVFLHEWGHGLDDSTGGGDDLGTAEAVADTTAMLYTRDPCLGVGFWQSKTCKNCGACSGVRNLAAFANGGISTLASPANVTSPTGIACERFGCPYLGYSGVMGYEAHCESYIASTAVWDLGTLMRAGAGEGEVGWRAFQDLWYDSLPTTKDAYELVSGGECNSAAAVDGCAATNFYQALLAADDDDGDLSNGTPHGCDIWYALSMHGIACSGSLPRCHASQLGDSPRVDWVTLTPSAPTATYSYQVTDGALDLSFATSGGSGQVALYVKEGKPPTTTAYDCASTKPGTEQRCAMTTATRPGTWYALLTTTSSWQEGSLRAEAFPWLVDGFAFQVPSLAANGEQTYRLPMPAGVEQLTVSTEGWSAAVNVYLRYAQVPTTSSYDCQLASTPGHTASCTVATPLAGDWYVWVHATSEAQGGLLTASYPVPLANGVPEPNVRSQGQDRLFSLHVPANTATLSAYTAPVDPSLNGSLELYVKKGSPPTPQDYTCKSSGSGANQLCLIKSPASQPYYLLLHYPNGSSQVPVVSVQVDLVPK